VFHHHVASHHLPIWSMGAAAWRRASTCSGCQADGLSITVVMVHGSWYHVVIIELTCSSSVADHAWWWVEPHFDFDKPPDLVLPAYPDPGFPARGSVGRGKRPKCRIWLCGDVLEREGSRYPTFHPRLWKGHEKPKGALWHRVSRRNPTCVPLFPQSTFIYFPWFSTGWYDKLNLFYYLIFPSLSSFICPFGSPMIYLLSSCVMNPLRSFHKATAPLPTPYETFSASLVPWPSWLWKDSAKRPSRDATSGSSALPFWFPQILAYL